MLHTTIKRLSYHDRFDNYLSDLVAKLPRVYGENEPLGFDAILEASANPLDPFSFTNSLWFLKTEHQHVDIYRDYAVAQIKKTNVPANPYPDALVKLIEALDNHVMAREEFDALITTINNAGIQITGDKVMVDFVAAVDLLTRSNLSDVRSRVLSAQFDQYKDNINEDTLTTIRGVALLSNNYEDYIKAVASTTYDLTIASVTEDFTERYTVVSEQQKSELIALFNLYDAQPGEKAVLI